MLRPAVVVAALVTVATLSACHGGSTKAGGVAPSTPGTSAASPTTPSGSSGAGSGVVTSSSAPVASATPTPIGPPGGPVPARFTPISATFVSADDGWALGTAPCAGPPCTSIVRTRDGGRSWQGIPAPRAGLTTVQSATQPAGSVRTIRFADQSNGWVAGRALYATHDGGRTWRSSTLPGPSAEVVGLGTAAGRVYAEAVSCTAGDECLGGATTVYTAAVGSDSWTKLISVSSSGRRPGDLVVADAGWYLPTEAGIDHAAGAAVPSAATNLSNPCPGLGSTTSSPRTGVCYESGGS